jgi:ComF family protein
VRLSILRYKFYGRRNYACAYGKILAMKIMKEGWDDTDVLTWIPISRQRKFRRGYDQTELMAKVAAEELGLALDCTLKKIRHTKPQSVMGDAAHRRANILGAYEITDPALVKDKRVLLLDDIVTTGATASECARVLLTAGAKEVKLATLAVASHETQRK